MTEEGVRARGAFCNDISKFIICPLALRGICTRGTLYLWILLRGANYSLTSLHCWPNQTKRLYIMRRSD